MSDHQVDASRIVAGTITAAKISSMFHFRQMLDSQIAKDEAEAIMFKLKGYEQSKVDPEMWTLWK